MLSTLDAALTSVRSPSAADERPASRANSQQQMHKNDGETVEHKHSQQSQRSSKLFGSTDAADDDVTPSQSASMDDNDDGADFYTLAFTANRAGAGAAELYRRQNSTTTTTTTSAPAATATNVVGQEAKNREFCLVLPSAPLDELLAARSGRRQIRRLADTVKCPMDSIDDEISRGASEPSKIESTVGDNNASWWRRLFALQRIRRRFAMKSGSAAAGMVDEAKSIEREIVEE